MRLADRLFNLFYGPAAAVRIAECPKGAHRNAGRAMLNYLTLHIVETPGTYNALQQLSYAAIGVFNVTNIH